MSADGDLLGDIERLRATAYRVITAGGELRRELDLAVKCAVSAERDLMAARERIAELEGLLAMRGES